MANWNKKGTSHRDPDPRIGSTCPSPKNDHQPPPRNHALWSGLMKTHGRGAVGWLASAQRIPGPQNLSHVWGVLRILSNVHIPPSAPGAVPRALQTTDEISYVGELTQRATKETGLRFLLWRLEKQVLETHWRSERMTGDFGRVFRKMPTWTLCVILFFGRKV